MKQERILKLIKKILGWPLSLVALFFVIKIIAPETILLLPHLKQANLLEIFFGVCSFIIYFFLRGYLWHTILMFKGYSIPIKDAIFLWGYSEIKRYVPGGIWSFLGRTVSFNNKGIPKKEIVHALIIEAQLIVLGSSFLSIFALSLFQDIFVSLPHKQFIIISALLIIVIFVFHNIFLKPINKNFLRYILPNFMPQQSLFVLLISVVAFSFFGLGTYLVSASIFYLNLKQIIGFMGFFVFSFLAGYLSIITPMGLGVREGVIAIGLSKTIPIAFAGFISIFSRIMLMVSETIFMLIAFIWMYSENGLLIKIEKIVKDKKQEFILFFFVCIYIAYFTLASFLRYDNFYAGRFDLGNMDQTVWNTINGRIFQTSSDIGLTISRLSTHADFILILLSPLYLLWSHPKTLLLIQSVILGLGGIFVFLIAKEIIKNKNLALIFGFLFLMNPLIQFTNLYDFHAVTIATTTLLASFYFLLKRKYLMLCIFLILSGITKEQVWTITALFGIPLLFTKLKKIKILGAIIIISSLTLFGYLVGVAIPYVAGGKEHFALSYYSNFGNSPAEIIKNVFLSPQKIILIFFESSRLEYLKHLFMPLGFISFLSPAYLIFAIPDLLIDLLSNNANLREIYYQYTSTITPFIFISGIYGVRQFSKWFPKIQLLAIALYIIFFTFMSAYSFGPLPGAAKPNLDMFTKPQENKEVIENFLSTIPENYTVAATNNLGAHLSHRQTVFTVPVGISEADFVLFLLNDGFAQPSLQVQKEMIVKLSNNKKYVKIFKQGDFVVFKKL
ncbi:MAG: DUF2079 domain-containing protein [Candidatus Parcubacteria bacterium]|nr:DUF2079 domain-containing protein [Candidatus Parcubacteria bacterium]